MLTFAENAGCLRANPVGLLRTGTQNPEPFARDVPTIKEKAQKNFLLIRDNG